MGFFWFCFVFKKAAISISVMSLNTEQKINAALPKKAVFDILIDTHTHRQLETNTHAGVAAETERRGGIS